MAAFDAGVEERDRDALPVEAGQHDLGAAAASGLEGAARDRLGRRRGRVHGAHRVHPRDVVRALELRQGARGDEGGEAVERPREDLVARDSDVPLAHSGEQNLLRALRLGLPAALLLRGRLALGGSHPVGERRRREDDEHALPRLRGRLRAVAEDAVPGTRRSPSDRVAGALDRAGERQGGRHERKRRRA